ncbi:MAG: hypothetical protein ABUU24_03325, partial [Variovorax sp.]
MLASYVEWHMREAWRERMFADTDQQAKATRDPVAPATRSNAALAKAARHTLDDGTPVHSFSTLMAELATTRWWHTTTLAEDFGVAHADEDDLYAAMDWLLERQDRIQKKLAARHLSAGALVLYDLSSSYFEGSCCPLAKLGYSRDGKKGLLQVNYGLLTDARGHHRQHQVAFAARLGGQQRGHLQAGHRGAGRLHMAVGARARDLERRGHGHEGLALQRAPDDLDEFVGQVRQVAQGLVLDLAVLAVAAAQQVGAIDLVLVGARRSDDVSGAGTSCHGEKSSRKM